MNTHILKGHVTTAEIEWRPLVEGGVDTRGISVKVLRIDPTTGRAPSFLLRFEPGGNYPYHIHPAGEELFVLSGNGGIVDSINHTIGSRWSDCPARCHAASKHQRSATRRAIAWAPGDVTLAPSPHAASAHRVGVGDPVNRNRSPFP
jgi:ChrR Cupin-like domain